MKRGYSADVDFKYEAALGADANSWARADHIVGMTPELIARARKLGLVDALNLYGSGSTTMVGRRSW